ncbi:Yop proteins translocation protein K [Endozoicomonas sp. Mp262]|uniref:Yop proteins translocation protein K n=1 Tax=Endozoicomonas sp. Mp262 TaxID=2919499 RepID=UPI0021D9E7B0
MKETSGQLSFSTELFDQVTEFNLYPIRYMHHSWLKGIEHADFINLLKGNEQSHFFLSRYLLGCLNVTTECDYRIDSKDKKIALAQREELLNIALYIGIVLNEAVIRSVVRRHERSLLEECLGESAYFFAVKKAQFLINHAALSRSPEVLIDWQHPERFKSFLTISGLQVLGLVYSDLPDGFRKRLLLKFPKSWNRYFDDFDDIGITKEQGRSLLIKSHKEVNRQWQHL